MKESTDEREDAPELEGIGEIEGVGELEGIAELEERVRADQLHGAEERLAKLEESLQEAGGSEELRDRVARLRGELGWRGVGSLVDLVHAFRRLEGEEAARFGAHAVRTAGRHGMPQLAGELLAEAERKVPGHPLVELAREQLESGCCRGLRRGSWRTIRALLAGDAEGAARELDQLVTASDDEPEHRDDRAWARVTLAALAHAAGDHASAAAHLDAATELAGEGDGAHVPRLRAAIAHWVAGDEPEARRRLAEAIELGGQEDAAPEARFAAFLAREVLAALDVDEGLTAGGAKLTQQETPTFPLQDRGGRELLVVLAHLANDPAWAEALAEGGELGTLAHLRHTLSQAGERQLLRVPLEIDPPDSLAQLLRVGARVLVQLERAEGSTFALVVGIEPVAKVVFLLMPHLAGVATTTLADLKRRTLVFGGSCLVDLGVGDEARARLAKLQALGITHDDRFDRLDALHLDEDGRTPPRARVAALAEEIIDEHPDLQPPHRRRGEALLDKLRASAMNQDDTSIERWLAETRERFPEQVWPLALHADFLEQMGLHEEAAVAYADVLWRSGWHAQALEGRARCLLEFDRPVEADRYLRRALAVREDRASLHSRRVLLLRDRDLEEAELHDRIARELAPDDLGTILSHVDLGEEKGDLEGVKVALARAVELAPDDAGVRRRLVQVHQRDGDWEGSLAEARELVRLEPANASSWTECSWSSWAAGEGEEALRWVLSGIQRCGPGPALVGQLGRVLSTLLPVDAARDTARQMVDALGLPRAILALAETLGFTYLTEEWVELGESALARDPEDVNIRWRFAQLLLSDPSTRSDRDRIVRHLEKAVEGAKEYPLPRAVLAWHVLEDDPERAVALLEEADPGYAPAVVWEILARGLTRLGREGEAENVRSEVVRTYPAGALEHAGFLRYVGMAPLALDLVEAARNAVPDSVELKREWALTKVQLRDPEVALSLLEDLRDGDEEETVLTHLMRGLELVEHWDRLREVAEREIARRSRSSDALDPWRIRGIAAGAAAAAGDPAPREFVLDRASTHAAALRALVEVERRAGLAQAEEDMERLRHAAPGAWQDLQEERSSWA